MGPPYLGDFLQRPHVYRRSKKAGADHLEQEERFFEGWLPSSIKVAVWGTLFGAFRWSQEEFLLGPQVDVHAMGNSTTIHELLKCIWERFSIKPFFTGL